MSFSLKILDNLLIEKVSYLDNKINNIVQRDDNTEYNSNRVDVLEDRLNIVENQCKILRDLFNICNTQNFDNKLIQTMLLELSISSHNNSTELKLLKQRFVQTSDKRNTPDNDPLNLVVSNRQKESYTNESVKWTKVKKKKKNRKR